MTTCAYRYTLQRNTCTQPQLQETNDMLHAMQADDSTRQRYLALRSSRVHYLISEKRLKVTYQPLACAPLSQIKVCISRATRFSPPLSTSSPDCCHPQRRLNTCYSRYRSAEALWASGSRQWTWTGSRYAAYTDLGGISAILRVPLNESSTGR